MGGSVGCSVVEEHRRVRIEYESETWTTYESDDADANTTLINREQRHKRTRNTLASYLHLPLTPGALRGPQRVYFCYNNERIMHRGGSSFNILSRRSILWLRGRTIGALRAERLTLTSAEWTSCCACHELPCSRAFLLIVLQSAQHPQKLRFL